MRYPVALLLLSIVLPLHAADFRLELSASSGKPAKTAEAASPAKERTVLNATVDVPVTVRWKVRNADEAAVKDLLVHFFVVKQDQPNQAEVPKLTKHVVAESALTMDFRPMDATDGELTFRVAQPGCYLIRLELTSAGKKQPETFRALDLVVAR